LMGEWGKVEPDMFNGMMLKDIARPRVERTREHTLAGLGFFGFLPG